MLYDESEDRGERKLHCIPNLNFQINVMDYIAVQTFFNSVPSSFNKEVRLHKNAVGKWKDTNVQLFLLIPCNLCMKKDRSCMCMCMCKSQLYDSIWYILGPT